jgi:hypothetical protein
MQGSIKALALIQKFVRHVVYLCPKILEKSEVNELLDLRRSNFYKVSCTFSSSHETTGGETMFSEAFLRYT